MVSYTTVMDLVQKDMWTALDLRARVALSGTSREVSPLATKRVGVGVGVRTSRRVATVEPTPKPCS